MEQTAKIWMNGELRDWGDAVVHVGTHGLHYGTGVFEGIRCYETAFGPAVFRLTDHLVRFEQSAALLYMELPYTVSELRDATRELLVANEIGECYVRPIAFYGFEDLGVNPDTNPIDVAIMSWPWGTYLGEEGKRRGISAAVSSWLRVGPNTIPHAAKATGVYLNSMLATRAAKVAGHDEAIMLTDTGTIADGPGQTIFAVKDGTVSTPALASSILPGITRSTVLRLAGERGYGVEERDLIRTDLYTADEVFMTGTAAEVTPVRSVDDHELGVGPVTIELQEAYDDLVHGRLAGYDEWLEHLAAPVL